VKSVKELSVRPSFTLGVLSRQLCRSPHMAVEAGRPRSTGRSSTVRALLRALARYQDVNAARERIVALALGDVRDKTGRKP
jgi:hypothetical protein